VSLLQQPSFSTFGEAEWQQSAATRATGFGEYLGAKLGQSWHDYTGAGRALEALTEPPSLRPYTDEFGNTVTPEPGPGRTPLAEDAWRSGPFFREGIDYQEGMTLELAEARARAFDRRRYRDSLVARYQGGPAGQVAGFVAGMAASALSPESYIPFVGPGVRVAAVARLGVIGGRALTSAADATIGTALADALILPDLARRGEDVGITDFALDLALGAAVGGLFGAGGGLLERRALLRQAARATRIDGINAALDQLEVIADAIANDEPLPVFAGLDQRLRSRLLGGTAAVTPYEPAPGLARDEPFPGAGVTEVSGLPERGAGLAGFLMRQGGIRDEGGELRARDARLQRVGLVSNRGLSLDEATRAAWEAGYIGARDERPVEQALLDALDEEFRQGPRLKVEEGVDWQERTRQRELEVELAGIERELERVAEAQGHGPLSGTELAMARRLVQEQDLEPEDALIEALTNAALRDDEGRLFDAAGLGEADFDIPFEPVAGRAAEGAGERAGRPGEAGAGAAGGRGAAGPAAWAERGAAGEPAVGGRAAGLGAAFERGAVDGTGIAGRAGAAADQRGRSAEAVAAFVRQQVTAEREMPPPASVLEAQRRMGKRPANEAAALREMAQDLNVLPREGRADIDEMADVDELRRQGRVTAEEEQALLRADEDVKRAEGYAMAYETLATCTLRFAP
jgi:hypothetical protein